MTSKKQKYFDNNVMDDKTIPVIKITPLKLIVFHFIFVIF